MFGLLVAAIVVAATVWASACGFLFSYAEVAAPLGVFGEIGVRVQKTHSNCTLPTMEDYQFAWDNVQVLGTTEWEEVGANLYEKWFRVSLSETGDGYLMISKDCTKEGYQEAVLLITVLDPDDGGVWQQANAGVYPFEVPPDGEVESIAGLGAYAEGILTVNEVAVELPETFIGLNGDLGEARLFFIKTTVGDTLPLLVVSEEYFVRFDHLIESGL